MGHDRARAGRVCVLGTVGLWSLLLLAATGCSKLAPIRDPSALSAAPSPELTEAAILDALPRRRWAPEAVEPGRIVAFFAKGNYVARVAITYDAQQVQIRYLGSEGLSYTEKGERRYIHKAYLRWVRVLHREIDRALRRAYGQLPPPTVSAAPQPVEATPSEVTQPAPGAPPRQVQPAPPPPPPPPAP